MITWRSLNTNGNSPVITPVLCVCVCVCVTLFKRVVLQLKGRTVLYKRTGLISPSAMYLSTLKLLS